MCIVFSDFDERTTDDWDVDMSVYYEPGAGDKDARDFVTMREEAMLRSGRKAPVIDKTCIGQFEKFSKVSVIFDLRHSCSLCKLLRSSSCTSVLVNFFIAILISYKCMLLALISRVGKSLCPHCILDVNVSC